MGPFFVSHQGDLGGEHPQLRRRRGHAAGGHACGPRGSPTSAGSACTSTAPGIWNAHVATGTPLAEYGACADVLAVCLSKGLGAPVGSLVVGTADAIDEARVWRKRLGGGMRQVGVLAAAGLHALDHHVERLADDHEHARLLAEACGVDPARRRHQHRRGRRTGRAAVVAAAREHDVLVSAVGPRALRMVTHLDVTREQAETPRRCSPRCSPTTGPGGPHELMA